MPTKEWLDEIERARWDQGDRDELIAMARRSLVAEEMRAKLAAVTSERDELRLVADEEAKGQQQELENARRFQAERDALAWSNAKLTAERDRALSAGPDVVWCDEDRGPAANVCLGCGATPEKPHTWAECHAVVKSQANSWLEAWLMQTPGPLTDEVSAIRATMTALTAKVEALTVERDQLNGRRREVRQLLTRFTKYVVEDRAETPGKTRLARLTEQVANYLERTHDPRDILRGGEPEPAVDWRERYRELERRVREYLDSMGNYHASRCTLDHHCDECSCGHDALRAFLAEPKDRRCTGCCPRSYFSDPCTCYPGKPPTGENDG